MTVFLILRDIPKTVHLLAWTTTPWTLPGNTALAVDEDAEYSIVELGGTAYTERLVLASELLDANMRESYSVVGTKGTTLSALGTSPSTRRQNSAWKSSGLSTGRPPAASSPSCHPTPK